MGTETGERPARAAGVAGPLDAHPGARRLGLLLITVQLAVVVWLAFRPISAAWMTDTNLTPFATVRSELAVGTPHASGAGPRPAAAGPARGAAAARRRPT